jgi:hypothetical protein
MAEDPLARRRRQFPKLKGWHRSRSGNWQIEIRQFRVTMFENALGIVAATHLFATVWLRVSANGPLEIVLRGITHFGEGRSANRKNG